MLVQRRRACPMRSRRRSHTPIGRSRLWAMTAFRCRGEARHVCQVPAADQDCDHQEQRSARSSGNRWSSSAIPITDASSNRSILQRLRESAVRPDFTIEDPGQCGAVVDQAFTSLGPVVRGSGGGSVCSADATKGHESLDLRRLIVPHRRRRDVDDQLGSLGTTRSGLSQTEARARLTGFGPNRLTRGATRSPAAIALAQ